MDRCARRFLALDTYFKGSDMWKFTEAADWFESKRTQSDAILDQWVEDSHYNQGVMIVAASTKAVSTFGAGFVDILRLGDGLKEGSLAGAGKDALRAVAIFPVGRAASMLKSARGITLAKVVVDTGGPNCFWVASAKAFGQISHKYNGRLLASVDDIAKTLGMSMNSLWVIPRLSAGMAYLQRLGAKVGPVKSVTTMRDVERMVPFDGSVLMISVHLIKNGVISAGHAIYAFRTPFGQVRYMDRTVGSLTKSAYKSISDLDPVYRAKIIPFEAAVLSNVFVKSVAHDLHRLVIPILGVIAHEERK